MTRQTARFAVVLMSAVAFLVVAGIEQAQGQSWSESWGYRKTSPRLAGSGPLWTTPTVVRGLRSDRYYALVLTGSVKLGHEHYGRYYKGYYGDAACRWESTSNNQNYPTIAPQLVGVVGTDAGLSISSSDYRQDHVYSTGWFVPSSSTMTLLLAVRPSRDNNGQIHFKLVEFPPDANPNDYTFGTATATWQYKGDYAGSQPVNVGGQPAQGVGPDPLQEVLSSLAQALAGNGNGSNPIGASGSNNGWDPDRNAGGIGNKGLFGDGALPPIFEPSGTCVDSHQSMFGESGNSGGSGYDGNAINLLNQIAPRVYP